MRIRFSSVVPGQSTSLSGNLPAADAIGAFDFMAVHLQSRPV